MHFSGKSPKSVERLSYLLMLVVFSSVLYFVLKFFHKIPQNWMYLHVLGIAILIVLGSRTIKRLLG